MPGTATVERAENSGQKSDLHPNVLEVDDLRVYFYTEDGEVRAVDGVSFNMRRGRTTAIVGESGCGKSVTSFSILKLIQSPGKIKGGHINFYPQDGSNVDIAAMPEKSESIFHLRGGQISMIFQEPMTALSPIHTVGNQVCEAILLHQDVNKQEARRQAIEMLGRVGIPGAANRIDQYPFELSGGMRQRVLIAMALVCNPEILVADEPTTALDVTIQAQIMDLIKNIQKEFSTSTLLITHDLGVVAQMADDVAVMYLGRIVERGDVYTIMKNPKHPYTLMLLKSLPSLAIDKKHLPSIKGSVPSVTELPEGCPFHPRCPFAEKGRCDVGEPPQLFEVTSEHSAACLRWKEIREEEIEKVAE